MNATSPVTYAQLALDTAKNALEHIERVFRDKEATQSNGERLARLLLIRKRRSAVAMAEIRLELAAGRFPEENENLLRIETERHAELDTDFKEASARLLLNPV